MLKKLISSHHTLVCLPVALAISSLGATGQAGLSDRQSTKDWFEEARFGIFVHWDPRVQVGQIKTPVSRPQTKQLQMDALTEHWRDFNPVNFHADEWIDLFVDAGARYYTFTTKHQFGFCMYDCPYTDFDLMGTRFQRDITKELSEAAEGRIVTCLYHSTEGGLENEDRYKLKNFFPHEDFAPEPMKYSDWRFKTVDHLLSNYGQIATLWWDGGGPAKQELLDMIYEKQPHILMNGRIDIPGFSGDFYTPEQQVGLFNMGAQWECCMPIESDIWFWCGGFDVKDSDVCTKLLIQCAGGDGNLLLSISPMADGRIQPKQAETLRGIGDYLKRYGETIYDTRGGPYMPGNWGGSTRKENKIYLHITQILKDGKLSLPPLPREIKASRMLTPGTVQVIQTDESIQLTLDSEARTAEAVDRIVELTLADTAMNLAPVPTATHQTSLTVDAQVSASGSESERYGPESVVDYSDLNIDEIITERKRLRRNYVEPGGLKQKYRFSLHERKHHSRHWTAARSDTPSWIEVAFDSPVTFDELYLMEKNNRIRKFSIECFDGTNWNPLHAGKHLNYFNLKTAPVTAEKVRLSIYETEGGPAQLHIFDLFNTQHHGEG